jgi:hypothetical protein
VFASDINQMPRHHQDMVAKEQMNGHAAVVSEMRLTVIRPLVDVSATHFGRPAQ